MHTEVNHPLVQHKLSYLRDIQTDEKQFRELSNEITMLVSYEALKEISLREVETETPLTSATTHRLANDITIVPILRAGVGMLEGMLSLIPNARVGFVGMYRDPDTKQPVEYYAKLPLVSTTHPPLAIVVDPMLATGGSIVATIDLLKREGFEKIVVVSIIAAPEGIAVVEAAHPGVPIFTASIDSHLDEHKYIVPGLGDAGDRLFGTL